MRSDIPLRAIVAALLAVNLSAVASTARLGEAAAPLSVQEWIRGKEVPIRPGTNIHVLSFWATWCPSCLKSIPELSALQKSFKDKGVVVTGISNEDPETLRRFLKEGGERMDYLIAADKEDETFARYMGAYGQRGIPTVFVVGKDAKVLWFGPPGDRLERVVKEVVAGTFDVAAEQRLRDIMTAVGEYLHVAAAGDPKAAEKGRTALDLMGTDVDFLCEFALIAVVDSNLEKPDLAMAEASLARAEKAAGAKDARVLSTRGVVSFESGKREDGMKLVREALALAKTANEKARCELFLRVMENRLKPKTPVSG